MLVRRLVDLACQAPSVHNTQPWLWRATGERVRLYADRSRQLTAEDPVGRNLIISCGAALDHFRLAAAALGFETEIVRFPADDDGDLLAEIGLRRAKPSPSAAEDIRVIRSRCTDRRRFTSWPVPEPALARLVEEARSRGALAIAVDDPGTRFRLEALAHHAYITRANDPAARREQSQWVGSHRSFDGVPVAVLPAEVGPTSARFGPGLVPESRSFVENTDGVLAVGGESDEPAAWLTSGEALSSLWLRATRDGLSVVPLSLPIEVEAVRARLSGAVFGGELGPHILLRIGWQAIGRSELPRTPRRPVDQVLRT
jgi:hypothetical protein